MCVYLWVWLLLFCLGLFSLLLVFVRLFIVCFGIVCCYSGLLVYDGIVCFGVLFVLREA